MFAEADITRGTMKADDYQKLLDRLGDASMKHNAKHRKKRTEEYEAALSKKQRKTKKSAAAIPTRNDVPCQLGGGVRLRLLMQKNDCMAMVDAECAKRGMSYHIRCDRLEESDTMRAKR